MTEQNNQIQDKKIILVLDTSWLMEIGKKDYNVLMDLLKPPEVEIRIHNRVFKELDGLKNVEGKSLQARRSSKFIEEALSKYRDRVQISDFGIKQPAEKFASALQSEVDAIVLTTAEQRKENDKVIILTTDRNQRVLAENERIKCASSLTEKEIQTNTFFYTSNTKSYEYNTSSEVTFLKWFFFLFFGILCFPITIILAPIIIPIVLFVKFIESTTPTSSLTTKYDSVVSLKKERKNKNTVCSTRIKSRCEQDEEWWENDWLKGNDYTADPAFSHLSCNVFYNDS